MRTFLSSSVSVALASAAVLVLAHCGSSSSPDLFDGGAADGAPGNDDGSAPDDASSSDGGAGDTGGDASDCAAALADVAAKRAAATKCTSSGSAVQCNVLVEDTCCPTTVASATSLETKAFQAAVAAFKRSSCHLACPAIACRTEPSNRCDGKTSTCSQT